MRPPQEASDPGRTRAEDARFLGLALDLASKGQGRTRPNPMVGAIVVKDGEIVGCGYHARAGEEHAEVIAIGRAGKEASGATLYSSLEPCCHQGRTGPCVDRIVGAGVRRVVACTVDPDPRVNGRGLEALRAAGLQVSSGLLEPEARRLNEAFAHFVTARSPFVTLKAGASLDGKIGPEGGPGREAAPRDRWITSQEARREAMRLRDRNDAILVGIGTVLADDPLLTVREPAESRPIVRAVLDSSLRTPPGCRLLRSAAGGPVVLYHAGTGRRGCAEALCSAGAVVVKAGDGPRVDLDLVLSDLAQRDVMGLLVEGGGEVLGSFLAERKFQKVCLFTAPTVLGPGSVAFAPAPGAGGWMEPLRLGFLSARRVGPDLMIEAEPWLRVGQAGSLE